MRRNTLKLLAFASAVSLGFAMTSNSFAQPVTVNASIVLTSAITTTDGDDMDFGEWVAIIGTTDAASDDVTITLTNDGSLLASVTGVTDSTVLLVTAPVTEGTLTVETPAASILTMTRGSTSDFTDTNISLDTVAYRTTTETSALNADADTGTVTVLVGGTPEDVSFGGTIVFDATAADATHLASFEVTFSY